MRSIPPRTLPSKSGRHAVFVLGRLVSRRTFIKQAAGPGAYRGAGASSDVLVHPRIFVAVERRT